MKFRSTIALGVCFMLFGTHAIADEFAIPGTGDGVAVLKSIAKDFGEKTGVDVRIPDSIGSGGGVKAAGADNVVLARVARGIKEKEKKFGLSYTEIFKVPTVFFVHADVTVNNLSEQQILDVFSGNITNWKDVGGQDTQIVVVRREEGDSSLKNLQKYFPRIQKHRYHKRLHARSENSVHGFTNQKQEQLYRLWTSGCRLGIRPEGSYCKWSNTR